MSPHGRTADQRPRKSRINLKKEYIKMEKERSYNKMMSPQQQIKYEFTNQGADVFDAAVEGVGF